MSVCQVKFIVRGHSAKIPWLGTRACTRHGYTRTYQKWQSGDEETATLKVVYYVNIMLQNTRCLHTLNDLSLFFYCENFFSWLFSFNQRKLLMLVVVLNGQAFEQEMLTFAFWLMEVVVHSRYMFGLQIHKFHLNKQSDYIGEEKSDGMKFARNKKWDEMRWYEYLKLVFLVCVYAWCLAVNNNRNNSNNDND